MKLTTKKIINKLGITSSSLYKILKRKLVTVETSNNGRYLWNEKVYKNLKKFISKNNTTNSKNDKPAYKTITINNRRYLGNKYKLLNFIRRIVNQNCKNVSTFADIFAGTGSVASSFLDKTIITNDILYSNYLCHVAWFSPEKYSKDKIVTLILKYNNLKVDDDNYVSINFSNTYFSMDDCKKIGYIREDIEQLYQKNLINFREKAILITSLLYAMDKIANTCGHYDAFIKHAEFNKHLELAVPDVANNNDINNKCFNVNSNDLVKNITADLFYIDPPYNSRQYCDAYHLLENIARWEKPTVYGIAKKMDRGKLKSEYCTKNAIGAFANLIHNINAKYILLSYNNTALKGADRSNAKMADEDLIEILSAKGKVTIFSHDHKNFTTGKSNIKDNQERLFLCECYKDNKKNLIQSPLNYTGGKFKLLSQILPHFPTKVNLFIDLFSGGGNVGINVPCNKVIFNDHNKLIKNIFETLKNLDKKTIFMMIDKLIEKYNLSDTYHNSYSFYNCTSSNGLAKYNNEKYLNLRSDFNECKNYDSSYYIKLYTLIVYSFNNQIRFNKKNEFNLPVGKRDFNIKIRKKLSLFIDRLKSGDYIFECQDFRKLDNSNWDSNTFVYADPPYFISHAPCNDQNGWTKKDEIELYEYLDNLDKRGIKFALSNVLRSKGKENTILLKWLQDNQNHYRLIPLNYNYNNSNYHIKDRNSVTEEVLIVNY